MCVALTYAYGEDGPWFTSSIADMDGQDDGPVPDKPDTAAAESDDVEGPRQAARLARRKSAIEHGRRLGGTPGAMMAGAMLALQEIYQGSVSDEIVTISETPDEPDDVDRDGLSVSVDGTTVASAALPATAPLAKVARRRSRRRR